jgi:uncharacterized protein (DUF2147 family)
MLRHIVALGAGLALATPANASAEIGGSWLTPGGKSIVEIKPCAGGIDWCGRIAWLRDPLAPDGGPVRDAENRDAALRQRPLLGIELLSGFRRASDGVWKHGRIYNPEDGRIYNAQLRRSGNGTLEVKGCALSIFCRTQHWTRVDPR